jgi:hypothetical protein
MPDLNFQIEGAEAQRHAAAPALVFALRVTEATVPATLVHSVILRCQVRIEPARRSYTPSERTRLRDLFGTPDRWGQTLRPMPWTHVNASVPSFEGSTTVDLPVACSFDFSLAATRYFDALEGGEIPLCFLFSGTIFYEAVDGALRVAPIAWEKECTYRLDAATWRALMNAYYPNTAWLALRKDVFDRLDRFRSDNGLPTWEQALERLLASNEEALTP